MTLKDFHVIKIKINRVMQAVVDCLIKDLEKWLKS